jgi:hypothetical protein
VKAEVEVGVGLDFVCSLSLSLSLSLDMSVVNDKVLHEWRVMSLLLFSPFAPPPPFPFRNSPIPGPNVSVCFNSPC